MLLIIGASRSGSTAVADALARRLDAPFVGETIHTWSRIDQVETCSCQLADHDCPIWGPIVSDLRREHGRWARTAPALQAVERGRPWAMTGARGADATATSAVAWLFDALSEALGRPATLVDSSKRPGYAGLLEASGFLVTPVWVRRRPAPVIKAETQLKPNPSVSDPGRLMGGRSRVRAALAWANYNLQAGAITRLHHSPTVHFDRWQQDPTETIEGVVVDCNLQLSPGYCAHALHGNPRTLEKVAR